MRLAMTLVTLSCISLLGACAYPGLVPEQSTDADVRARMGSPTDTRAGRDGERILEYSTGPEGVNTYVVRVGADGKVKEVTQVLTEEQLAKIIPAKTTKAEVRNLLGRPSFEDRYPAGLTWSWRFARGGVSPGYLVVRFNPDDTVYERIAIIDLPGDRLD